ncbi:MAG: glucosylglycerol-phosphate synthase [Rhodoferax sp.]|uniref:glucosylglycerol-phosphate synthase n=1 Tax=Rhodoferax sp. TaxID=50421 RepID=UPI0032632B43
MHSDNKLILATDIDGTFLFPETHNESTDLYKFIKDNQKQIILIYTTGRGHESIMPLLDDPSLPKPDYIIADVGATILKKQGDSYTPVMPIQNEIAEKWPGREKIVNSVMGIKGLQLQEVPQERRCSFFYEDPEIVSELEEIANDLGLAVLTSAGKYLDFLPLGVSKGSTLISLLASEGLPQENVLVAGDTLNDLSLMRTGYRGVAVHNAEPRLKQAVEAINKTATPPKIYLAEKVGPNGILEAMHHHGFSHALGGLGESQEALYGDADLVIVYHRQPFDEVKEGDAYVRQSPKSPNGILPTLLGFFAEGKKGAWVAWSQRDSRNPKGFEVDVPVDPEKYPHLMASRVALTPHDVNIFYKQFSKEAFWPIIFSFPERATFIEEHWLHFCEINRLFAERTATVAAFGATIWIHDYNLWMTPAYLRDLRPDLKIAFFHHTAFPGADIFNILPWKGQIIASLLKCDYVGFHIPRYVENFVDVVRSNVSAQILEKELCAPTYLTYGCALGVEEMTRKIQTSYGVVGVGAHPVGIDNSKIKRIYEEPSTQKLVDNLLQEANGRKIIFSVERLDYVKGPIEKMLAYEKFLEKHPEWHEKVIMLNIVTPAAPGMEIYEATREKVDQVVGRINGRFSRLGWTPVRYFYRSMPFEELVAFYVAADIAWITPLRDGLNLVCKEYVSAKAASNTLGSLVLSEFAGAAVELKGAVLTNPYDENSLIQGILTALNLEPQESAFRMATLQQRVQEYDVNAWGQDFMKFRDA